MLQIEIKGVKQRCKKKHKILLRVFSLLLFLLLLTSCLIPSLLLFFLSPFLLTVYFCVRSIYDDQPNAHKRFMEKLDARIRNHDREIEKMCNFHHQGFVDAITELLKVRTDAEKLMVRERAVMMIPECSINQPCGASIILKIKSSSQCCEWDITCRRL